MELNKFKNNLEKGICPFCNKKLQHYDGSLGYESLRCYDCKINIDNNGLNFEVE